VVDVAVTRLTTKDGKQFDVRYEHDWQRGRTTYSTRWGGFVLSPPLLNDGEDVETRAVHVQYGAGVDRFGYTYDPRPEEPVFFGIPIHGGTVVRPDSMEAARGGLWVNAHRLTGWGTTAPVPDGTRRRVAQVVWALATHWLARYREADRADRGADRKAREDDGARGPTSRAGGRTGHRVPVTAIIDIPIPQVLYPVIGFTGTKDGITSEQLTALERLFRDIPGARELHHGDCVGADDAAHRIGFVDLRWWTEVHPPIKQRRACGHYGNVRHTPKEFLARNLDIVQAADLLVAVPKEFTEQQRSGTWSTVRRARQKRIPIGLIFPDGSLKWERPDLRV
jgi:hypothetical protein